MRREDCSWNKTYNAYTTHTDDDIVGDTALGKKLNIHYYLKDLIFSSQQSCFVICLRQSGLCPQISLTTFHNLSHCKPTNGMIDSHQQ